MRDWDAELTVIENAVKAGSLPSVTQIETRRSDPWDVLVSTLISLRTKDAVTLKSSERLLAAAPDPLSLLKLDEDRIIQLIYPAGFYRTKAANLIKISQILVAKHLGLVPSDLDTLLTLPGVGLKTANLVLSVGFGIPAICVDIHVHRIANRRAWIDSRNPDESEKQLTRIIPKSWWIDLNRILVSFGQTICTPVSPRCSVCPVQTDCPRIGVERQR